MKNYKSTIKNIAKFSLVFLGIVLSFNAQAQEPEMAEKFRQDGMIYVVIVIMSIVMIGLLLFVFLTDRKVKKLEKLIKDEE